MASTLRSWRHNSRRDTLLRSFCTNLNPLLPVETLIEEETLPFYNPRHYYPVKIGDLYQSQYQVLGKLGYGAYSTVWLCRHLCEHKYAALKVSTCPSKFPEASHRESKIYEHLSKVRSPHLGQSMIRELYNTFELNGVDGPHQCLVLSPMHMDILEMMKLKGEPLSLSMLKMVLQRLLTALDFLHNDAGVIHTDIKSDNLMLTVEDQSMLERFEQAELETPTPRKIIDESRTIYQSRPLGRPKTNGYGLPTLCDFGEARIGRIQSSGPFVQPHIYRAPEIIFEMEWGPPIDIWNIGCLIWDLFEGEHLFGQIFDSKGHHDPFLHLARMVSLIGPPPADFVQRSETTEQCFHKNGQWIAEEEARILPTTLEDMESRLEGHEKTAFLKFLRSMLRWLPEGRKTARELLDDPWLQI